MQEEIIYPSSKNTGILKKTLIEIGIVIVLVVAVLGILTLFKLIDISTLIPSNINTSAPTTRTPSLDSGQKYGSETSGVATYPPLKLLVRNNALHYAHSISEFEGQIKEINTKGGFDDKSGLNFQSLIVLEVGSESATARTLIPKEAAEVVRVRTESGDILRASDLKIGDRITIKITHEVLAKFPNNIKELLITRLK